MQVKTDELRKEKVRKIINKMLTFIWQIIFAMIFWLFLIITVSFAISDKIETLRILGILSSVLLCCIFFYACLNVKVEDDKCKI